ncbi:putative C6 transcription factor PTB64984.1 putative C6 transcription factor [Diplogelasinospora grovesii]|uniref:C6 transcription factor PTB64984.1 putative C6 transcription factor n=1 Tax=Diplogelasinospora grovesii TaxID=303347 RepID=A0AAN6N7R3_9PEZI|nr:putative C6 transcription factor PTB64984.1 putative C6 transcription factor [Diplogelasinospora grovesii]
MQNMIDSPDIRRPSPGKLSFDKFVSMNKKSFDTASPPGPLNGIRKKRPHSKSRQGCIACKRRRVKCDERSPCSNCTRRKETCTQVDLFHEESVISCAATQPRLTTTPSKSASSEDTKLNLLHLELFHHFTAEIVRTLSFPQIWPMLIQQSFHEEYIMSTILCMAAAHHSFLSPDNPRYGRMAMQLLTKAVRLFRENLCQPITAQNCDALTGTSIMMHYLSWINIGFLDEQQPGKPLDLSKDQLFLLSDGVQRIFMQALPFFWREQSVFIDAALYSPRRHLEEAMWKRGENPYRFADAITRIYDDPRFQPAIQTTELGCPIPSPGDEPVVTEESPYNLGLVIERGLPTVSTTPVGVGETPDESWSSLEIYRALSTFGLPPCRSERDAFSCVARSLSLILSFVDASDTQGGGQLLTPEMVPKQADFDRWFFSFPVMVSGRFQQRELIITGDSRALVVLYHFYRAARLLLTEKESWWAHERSRVMEAAILKELRARGLGVCLKGDM